MDKRIIILIIIFLATSLGCFSYRKLYCKAEPIQFGISPKDNIHTGDAIAFKDYTPGATRWKWAFGDDEYSAEQAGSHTYMTPGNFAVTLTVYGSFGTQTKTEMVHVVNRDIHMPASLIGPTIVYIGENGTWQSPVSAEAYEWHTGSGGDADFESKDQRAFTKSFSSLGKKTIELKTQRPDSIFRTDVDVIIQPAKPAQPTASSESSGHRHTHHPNNRGTTHSGPNIDGEDLNKDKNHNK